MQFDHFR